MTRLRRRWNRWWMDRVAAPCWIRGLMVRGWDGHCWASGSLVVNGRNILDGHVICIDCLGTEEMES